MNTFQLMNLGLGADGRGESGDSVAIRTVHVTSTGDESIVVDCGKQHSHVLNQPLTHFWRSEMHMTEGLLTANDGHVRPSLYG